MALIRSLKLMGVRRQRREPALSSSIEAVFGRLPEREPVTGAPQDVFTPTRPVRAGRGLVGRQYESTRILQALTEESAHVVLYSERGRGKTSLVNHLVRALRGRGQIVARHTCEAGSTFDSIMRGLVRDMPRGLLAVPARAEAAGGDTSEGCDAAFPPGALRPADVVSLPARLRTSGVICIIDEFDRIEDAATRTLLADTIKQLSDRGVQVLFMIVGVSDSLDQILGQHPSIQRALLAVHLPLLTREDVAELVTGGLHQAGITLKEPLLNCLVTLSLGMPYMAQLVALRVLQAVRARGATAIVREDLRLAIERVVEEANPRITALLGRLTAHGRDQAMAIALQDVALAGQDAHGRIEVDCQDDGVHIGARVISLECWRRLRSANVVRPWSGEAEGADTRWFNFGERGVVHHVLLKAVLDDVLLPLDELSPAPGDVPAAVNAR